MELSAASLNYQALGRPRNLGSRQLPVSSRCFEAQRHPAPRGHHEHILEAPCFIAFQ